MARQRTKDASRGLPPWKKLLYLKQPYPDNYTNESFLSQLKLNDSVGRYSYWRLVRDFSLIAVHINNLVLVLLAFAGIYHFQWDPLAPIGVSSGISLSAFVLWQRYLSRSQNLNLTKLKSFALVIFILLVLSPVLKSLTRSTASDSIWALSFILTLLDILLHDYALDTSVSSYKPVVSTNISLFNALVLASRLNSTLQVFCFILFAIQVNILLPLFDFSLRKKATNYHHVLTCSLLGLVHYLMFTLCDVRITLFWVSTQIVLLLLLPGYFIFLQRYKNELAGPWDIAKPVIRST